MHFFLSFVEKAELLQFPDAFTVLFYAVYDSLETTLKQVYGTEQCLGFQIQFFGEDFERVKRLRFYWQ
jgi:hypothetical protein